MPFCGRQCSKYKITYLTESFLQQPEEQYINQKKVVLQDVQKMKKNKIKLFFNECQICIKNQHQQTKLKFFILLLIKDVMNVKENFVVELFIKYIKQLLFKIAYLPDNNKLVENSQKCLDEFTDLKRYQSQNQKVLHLEYSKCWQTWKRMYENKFTEIQTSSESLKHLFSNIEVYYQYENSNQDFQIMIQNKNKQKQDPTIEEEQNDEHNSQDLAQKYIDVINVDENDVDLQSQKQYKIQQNFYDIKSSSNTSESWNINDNKDISHQQEEIESKQQAIQQSGSFNNKYINNQSNDFQNNSQDKTQQKNYQFKKTNLKLDFPTETEDYIDKKLSRLSSQTKDINISTKQKNSKINLKDSLNNSSSKDEFLQQKCYEDNQQQSQPFSFTNNGSQDIEKFLFTFQKRKLTNERLQNEQIIQELKSKDSINTSQQDSNLYGQNFQEEQLQKICIQIPGNNIDKSFGSDIRTSYNFTVSNKLNYNIESDQIQQKKFKTQNQNYKSIQKNPQKDFDQFRSERFVSNKFPQKRHTLNLQSSTKNQNENKVSNKNPPIKLLKKVSIKKQQNEMSSINQQDIINQQLQYEGFLENELENLKQNLKRISQPYGESKYELKFGQNEVQNLRRNSANMQRKQRQLYQEIEQLRSQSRSIAKKRNIYKDIIHNYGQLSNSLKEKIIQQKRASCEKEQIFMDYKYIMLKRLEQQDKIINDQHEIKDTIIIQKQNYTKIPKKVASLKPIYKLRPQMQNQNINENINYQKTVSNQQKPMQNNKKIIINSELIQFQKKTKKNKTYLILKPKKQNLKTKLFTQNEKYYKIKKIHNEHKEVYQCIPINKNMNGNQIIQIQILENNQIIKQHFLRINLEPLFT